MDWYDTNRYGNTPGPANSGGPVPRWGANREFDRYYRERFGLIAVAESEEEAELRRAAWATWKTPGPTFRPQTRPPAKADEEDEELNRALALSIDEQHDRHAWKRPAAADPIVVPDDDENDEELNRVLELSYLEQHDRALPEYRRPGGMRITVTDENGNVVDRPDLPGHRALNRADKGSEMGPREPKRARRDETPEEERKMLEEAIKASMEGATDEDDSGPSADKEDSPEASLRAANEAFQAERAADRERQRRERERKRQEAIAASQPASPSHKQPSADTSNGAAKPEATVSEETKDKPAVPSDSTPLLSRAFVDKNQLLDRAQMERERLARQAARQAQAQSSTTGASSVSKSTPGSSSSSGTKARIATLSSLPESQAGPSRQPIPTARSIHPLQSSGPFPSDAAGEYYLDGEMRHSQLDIGQPAALPTFNIHQVIGKKSEIALLILSSFVLDDEWLAGKLPGPDQTPTIMVRPPPREKFAEWNGKIQAQPAGEVYAYPRMIGEFGSAHMKFAWIFYKTGRLRVVVMSANLVPYDWDWIENSIFVQDFLPAKTESPLDPQRNVSDDLPWQFSRLFIHLKLHKALRFLIENHQRGAQIPFTHKDGFADMAKWDWSRVKVRLVMSVPGTYTGPAEVDQYGICRLGHILRSHKWVPQSGERLVAEYQGSSLGTYSFTWYDTFYRFCTGKSFEWLRNAGAPRPTSWPPLEVIFPSLATVDRSVLGRDGGGTMFSGKAFTSVTKPLFHDANSKRGGVLMHAKVLIGLFEPQDRSLGFAPSPSTTAKRKADEMADDKAGSVGGWAYMGSHNFSSAAWGTVNLKKQTLNIRNYEMGIVFPLPRQSARAAADIVAPYKRPPRPYGADDVPWDQYAYTSSRAE